AAGAERTCDFKTGAIILQQPVEPAQIRKLLTDGKTDLLKGFVSKKTGRKFEAFLKYEKGKVGFEFAPREKKAGGKFSKKEAAPVVKLDFTGQTPVGQCPKCKGKVFESETDYICENSQREAKR
ncbi:MAG TPA: DNA topoisomerase III, partial [Verrucomicrobiales bacterium]|nr:DNA topoisomerase III [Verrucomicrobiales bacterium]